MTNQQIKRAAYDRVMKWEQEQGRTCQVHENDGYDLLSRSVDGDEIRHIEVKGTTARSASQFALEVPEFNAMREDERWWLYIVTGIGDRPALHSLDRARALNHLCGIYYQFLLKFGVGDFTNDA